MHLQGFIAIVPFTHVMTVVMPNTVSVATLQIIQLNLPQNGYISHSHHHDNESILRH